MICRKLVARESHTCMRAVHIQPTNPDLDRLHPSWAACTLRHSADRSRTLTSARVPSISIHVDCEHVLLVVISENGLGYPQERFKMILPFSPRVNAQESRVL